MSQVWKFLVVALCCAQKVLDFEAFWILDFRIKDNQPVHYQTINLAHKG